MFHKLGLTALAAGLVLVAGCSAPAPAPVQSPQTSSQPPASSAAPATSEAPQSSPAQPAGDAAIDDFVAKVGKGLEGVKSYHLKMSMSSAGQQMKFDGDVDSTDPQHPNQHLTMDLGKMTLEMIMIGKDSYMKGLLGSGWVKVPKDVAEQSSSADVDQSKWLTENKDAFKKVENVGTESLDGVNTTHYRLTLDAAALKDLGAEAGASGNVVYDAWLDDSGLMRKAVFDLDTGKAPLKMEVLITKVNEPVKIKAPAKFTTMG